jgi:hypothetical protein
VDNRSSYATLSEITSGTLQRQPATAAVGLLLGITATSLADPLAATYGLYRAWRWFRD